MNKRVAWIDVGKGIGILLVLLGHAFRDSMRTQYFICNFIYEWVYTFHMPFLMFLSGFTFMQAFDKYEKKGIKNFILGKIKRLIKPYVVYATLVFIIVICCFFFKITAYILTAAGYNKINIVEFIGGLITGENAYSFHLWYIYSLAIISIMVFLILLILKKVHLWAHYRIVLFAVMILTLIYSLLTINREVGIRILSSVRGMLPWYVFGVLIENKDKVIDNRMPTFCAGVGILPIFGLGLLPYIISDSYPILYRVIKYIFIAATILGLTNISKFLKNSKILSFVGRESMGIYLFHQPFIAAGIGVIAFDIIGLSVGIAVIVTFILSLICPLIINYLLKKAKLTLIFF